MMKTAEIGNLNRYELFDMFVRKCMSRARLSLYGGLLLLILTVAVVIWLLKYGQQSLNYDYVDVNVFLAFFILTGAALGLSVLYILWYIKRIDSVDTPDQLLYFFEKKTKFEKICSKAPEVGLALYFIYDGLIRFFVTNDAKMMIDGNYACWAFGIVVVLKAFYYIISRKDDEIIGQIEELVERR